MFRSIKHAAQHSILWLGASRTDQTITLTQSEKNETDVVVYAFHGTADRSSAFQTLASNITNKLPKGVSAIRLLAFDHRLQGLGIDDYAKQAIEKIQKYGDKRIIILGHSRGAIVAAYLTEYLAKDAGITVELICAFGGPFHGSPLSPKLFSESLKQMHVSSDFLKDLRKKMSVSPHHYCFIRGKKDVIVPLESTFVTTPHHSLVTFLNENHLSIVETEESALYTINAIKKRLALDKMAPAVCSDEKEEAPLAIESYISIDMNLSSKYCEVILELDEQIFELTQRTHLLSPLEKTETIKKLKLAIDEVHEEKSQTTLTLGQFIQAFLDTVDETTQLSRMDGLKKPLNPNPFGNKTPSIVTFIESFIKRHQNTTFASLKEHCYTIQASEDENELQKKTESMRLS